VKALYRLACRCGYEQAEEKIFAADGADWCWEGHATFFSQACGILDWYHASEHVWEAARSVNPSDAKSWADLALTHMRDGGGAALLAWLREQQSIALTEPGLTAIEKLIGYVAERVDRMDYPTYRARLADRHGDDRIDGQPSRRPTTERPRHALERGGGARHDGHQSHRT
jgi:hypothetical protein